MNTSPSEDVDIGALLEDISQYTEQDEQPNPVFTPSQLLLPAVHEPTPAENDGPGRLQRIIRRRNTLPPSRSSDPFEVPSDEEGDTTAMFSHGRPPPHGQARTPEQHHKDPGVVRGRPNGSGTAQLYRPQMTGMWWTKQMDIIGWENMPVKEQRKMSAVARIEEQPQYATMRKPACKKCLTREQRNGVGSSPCKVYTHEAAELFEKGKASVKCSKCRVGGEHCE